MTPERAADLAARTLAAINEGYEWTTGAFRDADRERVASDLAGIERHQLYPPPAWSREKGICQCGSYVSPCPDAAERVSDLIRTAELYGVTP